MTDETLIEVYSCETKFSLVLSGPDSRSYFGGPPQCSIQESELLDECFLHHVATLNHASLGIPFSHLGFGTPLFYGICHEGCEITYKMVAHNGVVFTSLSPKQATPDYPYADFPRLLPYYRLGIGKKEPFQRQELERRIANTGWSVRSDCVHAIMMRHPRIGVCIFDTIDEDAEIVFEYDYQEGTVRGVSQCT